MPEVIWRHICAIFCCLEYTYSLVIGSLHSYTYIIRIISANVNTILVLVEFFKVYFYVVESILHSLLLQVKKFRPALCTRGDKFRNSLEVLKCQKSNLPGVESDRKTFPTAAFKKHFLRYYDFCTFPFFSQVSFLFLRGLHKMDFVKRLRTSFFRTLLVGIVGEIKVRTVP
jgi:hypothetical protein